MHRAGHRAGTLRPKNRRPGGIGTASIKEKALLRQGLFLYQEYRENDWDSFGKCSSYAQNGYAQFFGEKAHANILSVDLHGKKKIEKIKRETLSCEVLTGLLGITVAKAVNHE